MAFTDGQLIKVNGTVSGGKQPMTDAGSIATSVETPGTDNSFPTEKAVRDLMGNPGAIGGTTPGTIAGTTGTFSGLLSGGTLNIGATSPTISLIRESVRGTGTASDITIVTEAAVRSAIETVPDTAKTTMVDADVITLWDSATSFVRKKISGTNLKAYFKTANDLLYSPIAVPATGKTTMVDADMITLWDSAATWAKKNITGTNLKAYLLTYFAGIFSNPNILINSNFEVNQLAVTGSVVLGAGVYGHDGFYAGAAGCSYTFAASNGVNTITISAGSLIQKVETTIPGAHTLSWTGTAEAELDGGGAAVSPITETLTGGANVACEWDTGTVAKVNLVQGSTATEWTRDANCELNATAIQARYQIIGAGLAGNSYNTTGITLSGTLPVKMLSTPTLSVLKSTMTIGDGSGSGKTSSGSTATYRGDASGFIADVIGFTSLTAPSDPVKLLTGEVFALDANI